MRDGELWQASYHYLFFNNNIYEKHVVIFLIWWNSERRVTIIWVDDVPSQQITTVMIYHYKLMTIRLAGDPGICMPQFNLTTLLRGTKLL
jgi:hypothetical protein